MAERKINSPVCRASYFHAVERRQKVAIATGGVFSRDMADVQRHVRLLVERLAGSSEVRITVVHPYSWEPFGSKMGISEVYVGPIGSNDPDLADLRRYSDRVGEALKEPAPDIILSQGLSVWKASGGLKTKLILEPHALEMFQSTSRTKRVLDAPARSAMRQVIHNSAAAISLGGKLTGILQEQVMVPIAE